MSLICSSPVGVSSEYVRHAGCAPVRTGSASGFVLALLASVGKTDRLLDFSLA